MKRVLWFVAPALIVALAAPVFAGGDKKCTASTQECLDMMAQKLKTKGWIGVELDNTSGKLEIVNVIKESPAEEAGLKAGDILVAVNGIAYADENNDKMEQLRKTMTKGSTFTFTILKRGKKEKDIDITLGSIPDDMLAKYVGGHMLEHANVEQAEE